MLWPVRMHTSILLYVDWSKIPFKVHFLDVSRSQPEPAQGRNTIHTQQRNIRDLCFDTNLLVVAAGREGVFTYNTMFDKLQWKVDGTPPGMEKDIAAYGVTTDGRGHLFVADYDNQCIHMYSMACGSYIRSLLKGTKSFGHPDKICWCEKSSRLLSLCWWKGKWHLKIISVEC